MGLCIVIWNRQIISDENKSKTKREIETERSREWLQRSSTAFFGNSLDN